MLNKLNSQKFSKYFLILMCLVFLLLFLKLIKIFIIQIILAIVISIIVYPVFKFILKIVKNRNLASFFTCIFVIIAILLPLIFLFNILIFQISNLINSFNTNFDLISNFIKKFDVLKLNTLMNSYIGKFISFKNFSFDWSGIFENILGFSSNKLVDILNKSYKLTLSILFNFAIIMFTLFYFLRDGVVLLIKLKEIIPISEDYKDKIIMRFYSITNATIRGGLLIAILQGTLSTLVLLIFGINNWLILGVTALIFSVVPFVGNGIVLVPVGIAKIITGNTLSGILIILISIGVISLVDNILKPILIGGKTGVHDLLIFFSIIGGIYTFGVSGFILGPIIASVFLTVIQIYKIEFLTITQTNQSEDSLK